MNAHRTLWAAALALLLVGAAPNPQVEDLLRRGNEAFAAKKYAEAVAFYEKAEDLTADPGLVAFDKAAALYHLGHFSEAEQCYRRCLEDGEIPAPRRARALYDLGTSLLRLDDGKDARALGHAVRALRRCLRLTTDADLTARAAHNLELARLLWAKAKANPANPGPTPKDDEQKTPEDQKQQPGDPGMGDKGNPANKGQQGLQQDPQKGQKTAIETNEKTAGKGNMQTLPDDDELHPLDPRQTAEHLDRAASRIMKEQRGQRLALPRSFPGVKDW